MESESRPVFKPSKLRMPSYFCLCLIVPPHSLISARYKEQVAKVNRLRDDTVREIIKNSSDIVMFKEEVSKQLKHLRDFAETN